MSAPPRLFLIAGEPSGDQLGAALMATLRRKAPEAKIAGVGGPLMEREGLASLFPMSDIAVMGFLPVIARLATLLRRIDETARAAIAAKPDALVLIDSPDFTHRVARRVRARAPDVPILDYVAPTVWAWRPGRAPAMRPHVDEVLALLPFEPEAYARLGGPPCVYVGHPLVARLGDLRPSGPEEAARRADLARPTLLVLPGSRRSVVARHLPLFGAALARLPQARSLSITVPTMPHLAELVTTASADWPSRPYVVVSEADKRAAFRAARAALAASGTVTLELALAGVPMVAAYVMPAVEAFVARRLVRTGDVLLPNLILGRRFVPERIQEAATPERLAADLAAILADGEARSAQIDGFGALEARMREAGDDPAAAAADRVLARVRT